MKRGPGRRARATPLLSQSPRHRFWRKVFKRPESEGGCWVWQGDTSPKGYGLIRIGTKLVKTHIWAWEQVHGPVPEGKLLRHTCDNPPCVRPDHLIAGTHDENMQDMVERGRQARGEHHPRAKLTEAQVEEARYEHANGKSQADLSKHYGVSPRQIGRILRGENWAHPPTDQCPDPECWQCAVRDCPHQDPLHYHHDGCPSCYETPPNED